MIVQVQGTKTIGDYQDIMLSHHADFIQWAKKVIVLDAERNLTYKDMNTYAVCCIATSYDVKDAEAHAFLQNFEGHILEATNHS